MDEIELKPDTNVQQLLAPEDETPTAHELAKPCPVIMAWERMVNKGQARATVHHPESVKETINMDNLLTQY
ncbi:uncharacterized protein PHALS_01998 [Plasmopara halstedii]|uniref:Uncharacterized protein n=1 Tax=Plasmopara halstedii TaxID=4781 RepID=A0A0P1AUS7_PLAHL|nr:uncharacterized protein PHALS_01998 [Plasmopara halstedii]CEG45717.1 hypothetical protein PHALS_01998 [Plasmopara halstedii]|eukprot:XP_024582086.1 hypothetical protein PHALS_01998 [Plasmopara halstedii]